MSRHATLKRNTVVTPRQQVCAAGADFIDGAHPVSRMVTTVTTTSASVLARVT